MSWIHEIEEETAGGEIAGPYAELRKRRGKVSVACFNFVNRIALGLGVTYDEDELTGYKV